MYRRRRAGFVLQEWETNGLLDKSIAVLVAWVEAQNIDGLTVEIVSKVNMRDFKHLGPSPLIHPRFKFKHVPDACAAS